MPILKTFIFYILTFTLTACGHNTRFESAYLSASSRDDKSKDEEVVERHSWSDATVTKASFGQSSTPYLLDTGDRLRIFVYGQPSLSRIYNVDQGGLITVPLIGAVRVRGLTTFDLEEVIARKLGNKFVRDPEVTVDIQQNRPFFIFGEVRAPGQYPFVSGMTIDTAIAIAGGYSERASNRSFRITRRNDKTAEKFEVPEDYAVQPGDTVFVHERYF